jgi:hypothetical protein
MMRVTRSAYYAYARGKTYRESPLKVLLAVKVKECFHINRRRSGTRRIAAELRIGRASARQIMRRENLRAIQPKRFTPKDDRFKTRLGGVCQSFAERRKRSGG